MPQSVTSATTIMHSALYTGRLSHYRHQPVPHAFDYPVCYTWLDLAHLFSTVADGARVRAAALGSVASLTSGDNVLVGSIYAMLPSLLVEASFEDQRA